MEREREREKEGERGRGKKRGGEREREREGDRERVRPVLGFYAEASFVVGMRAAALRPHPCLAPTGLPHRSPL